MRYRNKMFNATTIQKIAESTLTISETGILIGAGLWATILYISYSHDIKKAYNKWKKKKNE